ncbi:MAG: hypothetical protein GTO02_19660 [Candidatus Dadabacteria bacterium]|nr:hypothetical protein [Candidatus Dadabacteria bacterium]NIQ16525.1 hypothetical protein [Candidatus Dadabacteria bacterium]
MKYILGSILGVFLFTSVAFSQQITDYHYDPGDALHPFKLISLPLRPPLGLLNIFVRGGYWVLDSEPMNRAFNIEYSPTLRLDSEY